MKGGYRLNKQQLKEIVMRYREHMSESAKSLLDTVGFEVLCELSKQYGGSNVYIPLESQVF